MKELDKKELVLKKNLEDIGMVRRIMSSPEGLAVSNQMIIDYLKDNEQFLGANCDLSPSNRYKVSLSATSDPEVELTVPRLPYHREWSEMSDLVNQPYYDTTMKYQYENTKTLDGVTIRISDYIKSELPEEEVEFLIRLGKIEEEFVASKVSRSLNCSI